MIILETEIRDAGHRQVKQFWHNFVRETVNYVGMGTEPLLCKTLKEEYNGRLLSTNWGYVVEFEHDPDATRFLLRWQ